MTAGPARATGWLLLLAAAGLAVAGLLGDLPGRVLVLPAALVLAGLGARDLLLRPVLSADDRGLSLVTGLRRRQVPWSEVEALEVVRDRRTTLLQVDLGSTLVVLSRLRLGRPPEDVLADVLAVRPG